MRVKVDVIETMTMMTMLTMTLCLSISLGERVGPERRRANPLNLVASAVHNFISTVAKSTRSRFISYHINNTYLPILIITSPKLLLPNPSSMHFHCSRTISLATLKSSQ